MNSINYPGYVFSNKYERTNNASARLQQSCRVFAAFQSICKLVRAVERRNIS